MLKNKYKHIFIIFNNKSGVTDALVQIKKLLCILEQNYSDTTKISLIKVSSFEEIRSQVNIACLTADVLIVAGGDGTLRVVADELYRSSITIKLMILPIGTVNLVARELAIPLDDIKKWAEHLLYGKIKLVYPLYINEQIFLTVAGVGADSYVISRVSSEEKRRFGKGAYIYRATELAYQSWGTQFSVVVNERKITNCAKTVLILHGCYYAGNYRLLPDLGLSLADKFFYVLVFDKADTFELVKYALLTGVGRLMKDPSVHIYKAENVSIHAESGPFPVQADGDIVCSTPVKVIVAARPLTFIG